MLQLVRVLCKSTLQALKVRDKAKPPLVHVTRGCCTRPVHTYLNTFCHTAQALKVRDKAKPPLVRCVTPACAGYINFLGSFDGPVGHETFKSMQYQPTQVRRFDANLSAFALLVAWQSSW
jgi:hypothetical protein